MDFNKFIPVKTTSETIIKETAKLWNVKEEDIYKKGRSQPLAFARQVAMFLTHELTGLSTVRVGKIFGNRDHTTVMYAIKQINIATKQSPQIRQAVEQLRLKLQTIPVK